MDKNYQIKIADFGISHVRNKKTTGGKDGSSSSSGGGRESDSGKNVGGEGHYGYTVLL
jgi:hypothetical protein